jgi:prepilin peptidase CpaA
MSHFAPHSWPSMIAMVMTLASAAMLLLAAGHDFVSRTVPNWFSVAIALFGIVASIAAHRLLISLGCGAVIFVVAAFCWRYGLMGGADVKLLGAIAIVLQPSTVAMFTVAMSLAGAAHAIAYILARRVVTRPPPLAVDRPRDRSLPARALRAERWRISRGGPLPYACAIAFGFFFVVLNGGAP